MRTFTLSDGSRSREVSSIQFGTGEYGYYPEAKAFLLLDTYCACGGRAIDTARCYSLFREGDTRSSEYALGRWFAASGMRNEIFLGTKGGHPKMNDMSHPRLAASELRSDLERSLEELGTDHVDIYWLHRDDERRPVSEIMETLNEFVRKGETLFLGASNWSCARVVEANAYARAHALTPFSAVQNQWSYAKTTPRAYGDPTLKVMDEAYLDACRDMGLSVFAFSSLAWGFFSRLDALGEEALPERFQSAFLSGPLREENLARYRRLCAVSEKYGLTLAQAALAYVTCAPQSAGAVLACSTPEHWKSNLETSDVYVPPEEFQT